MLENIGNSLVRLNIVCLFVILTNNCCVGQNNDSMIIFVDSLINEISLMDDRDELRSEKKSELFNWVLRKSSKTNISNESRVYLREVAKGLSSNTLFNNDFLVKDSIDELNEKLIILNKEISEIKHDLMEIALDSRFHDTEKQKAVDVLLKTHDGEVLEFLLRNEQALRFGKINSTDDREEVVRSTMISIFKEYYNRKNGFWALIPFLIEHTAYLGETEVRIIEEIIKSQKRESASYLIKYIRSCDNPIISEIIDTYFKI